LVTCIDLLFQYKKDQDYLWVNPKPKESLSCLTTHHTIHATFDQMQEDKKQKQTNDKEDMK
jgi:hypothetical protein